jgi:hypothetical protein
VLGSSDNQELGNEAEAYEALVESVTPIAIAEASEKAAHVARRGAEYGFAINGDVRVDMKTC